MAFKCQNPYCSYGDGYTNPKQPTINDDGTRPEHTRENSYSQHLDYKNRWHGYCLNCISDDEDDIRE